ncbi:hypothetical protein MUO79_01475 [Candidatus Bathyarchaeota archaeon]|nr:hypothetical protein [Candidatus Bathyarchaeota archaeon]
MPDRKTKTPLDQTALNITGNTPHLGLDVDEKEGILKAKAVVLIDPLTGRAMGASDFFLAHRVLTFNIANAVQNTWYRAFTGINCSFHGLGMGVTVANETVELRITIDGTILTPAGVALLFAGNRFSSAFANAIVITTGVPVLTMGAAAAALACPAVTGLTWLRGRAITIDVRKTTAGGASALQVYGVYYAK